MIKLKDLLSEGILSGGVKSGGTEAALDVIRAMTGGNSSRVGNLSNMSNWIGQYKDGIEFGLKKKMKVGGWARWWKKFNICQIHVPPLNDDRSYKIWRHELRHCQDGHFHKKSKE